jgi:tRNA-splicing ligase RtcB (3'-phosphate/5'-hydroxy nucleic acid ligase)
MSPTQNPARRADPLEIVTREMCLAAGIDPDSRVAKPESPRGMPAWCNFHDAARAARNAREAADLAAQIVKLRPQEERFQNSPLTIFGDHDENTIA